jgi:cytoskeletal protein RodZ
LPEEFRRSNGKEEWSMGTQEWILLALVLVIPLLIAIVVTLWTLEQALKRNKKNREDKVVRRASEPVSEEPSNSESDPDPDSPGLEVPG